MPRDCSDCPRLYQCDSIMGEKDCLYFSSSTIVEKESWIQKITKFFAKFFS